MEPWIALTIVAVLIQSSRTVLQKKLVGRLSVGGASFARFLYGLPLAWIAVGVVMGVTGATLPALSPAFIAYAAAGAIAQVVGNTGYIYMISRGNFTVVSTYGKTETVIAALFSFVVLGDRLSAAGLVGIIVTFVGVVVLAAGKEAFSARSLRRSLGSREMLYGLAVGAFYAVGSTAYRGAILELESAGIVFASFFTLACVTSAQGVVMGTWLAARHPGVLRETLRAWRTAGWVGAMGIGASMAWYTAFAQQVTAYVLAVGQLDLLLIYLWSHFHFKERARIGEIAGILVTVLGIILVVMGD